MRIVIVTAAVTDRAGPTIGDLNVSQFARITLIIIYTVRTEIALTRLHYNNIETPSWTVIFRARTIISIM